MQGVGYGVCEPDAWGVHLRTPKCPEETPTKGPCGVRLESECPVPDPGAHRPLPATKEASAPSGGHSGHYKARSGLLNHWSGRIQGLGREGPGETTKPD